MYRYPSGCWLQILAVEQLEGDPRLASFGVEVAAVRPGPVPVGPGGYSRPSKGFTEVLSRRGPEFAFAAMFEHARRVLLAALKGAQTR